MLLERRHLGINFPEEYIGICLPETFPSLLKPSYTFRQYTLADNQMFLGLFPFLFDLQVDSLAYTALPGTTN